MDNRKKGVVVCFNKDFGFIKPEHGSDLVYFHYTSIQTEKEYKELRRGDLVSYEEVLTDNKKHPMTAKDIREEKLTSDGKEVVNIALMKNNSKEALKSEAVFRRMFTRAMYKLTYMYVSLKDGFLYMISSSDKLNEETIDNIVDEFNKQGKRFRRYETDNKIYRLV